MSAKKRGKPVMSNDGTIPADSQMHDMHKKRCLFQRNDFCHELVTRLFINHHPKN
jgi:hypothetical protein